MAYKCKEKAKEQARRWRAANPEKSRESVRRWQAANPEHKEKLRAIKYGVSVEKLEELKASHRGLCAICKRQRKLCVDHDHISGRVRGLLCRKCNSAIGLLDDSFQLVIKAADYLRVR